MYRYRRSRAITTRPMSLVQRRVGQGLGIAVTVTAICLSLQQIAVAGSIIPNLTSTTSGIHLALKANNELPPSISGKAAEIGVDNYVWGAQSSGTFLENIPAAGVHHTLNLQWGRDYSVSTAQPAWFRNTHPDWIEYKADRTSIAYYSTDQGFRVPLDFTSSAVRQYMLNTYIKYALTTGGYAGIAWDQGETINSYMKTVGHYRSVGTLAAAVPSGATSIQTSKSVSVGTYIALGTSSDMNFTQVTAVSGSGPYTLTVAPALIQAHSSGEWLGSWVQQYTGSTLDSTYRSAQITAFAAMTQAIRAINPAASISINNLHHPWLTSTDQKGATVENYWRDLIPYADIVMDECGYTHCGGNPAYLTDMVYPKTTANPWLVALQDYQWLDSQGKGLLLTNYEPYPITSNITTSSLQLRSDCQWVLANYLLAKGSHTYLTWRGLVQVPGDIYYQPEYRAAIGSATDVAYQSQNVWMRDFTAGLAIVNPSNTTSYTVSLTAGKYKDLYGNPVTTTTLAPHSGLVLLG